MNTSIVVRSYIRESIGNFKMRKFSDEKAAREYYAELQATLPSCYEITITDNNVQG